MGLFGFLFKKKEKNIKLGLALGSGGAKGFIELGVLKAFEEANLKFDYIAGSSIGSIIGAFYANGYTSTDMLELIKNIDFSKVATNIFMINMDTFGLFSVIDETIGNLNIEDLKKPFRAVTTEYESGEEVVIKSGNVAKALCASSSYLPFFRPVEIDGKRYVDGAYANSVPADVVRNLGADYVIGVDLSDHKPKNSLLDFIFPSYIPKTDTPWEKGYKFADVVLNFDLQGCTSLSIREGNKMFDIGYYKAKEMLPQILSDIEKLKSQKKR